MSGTESAAYNNDPEWRMEAVDWNPISMQACHKPSSNRTNRAANTRCQVEGCPVHMLPVGSYYQRQHICENHFRALSITDASGCITRFCQQCTKLEPLDCFEGERRSCRDSLERRTSRRQRKRSGKPGQRTATKVAATGAASAAATAAGTQDLHGGSSSGSGNTTRLMPLLVSPLDQDSRASKVAAEGRSKVARTHGATSAVDTRHSPTAGAVSAGRLEAAAAQQGGCTVTSYWMSPFQQQQEQQQAGSVLPAASDALPATSPFHMAAAAMHAPSDQAHLQPSPGLSATAEVAAPLLALAPPSGRPPFGGGMQLSLFQELGTLSTFELDALLDENPDRLAEDIFGDGKLPPLSPMVPFSGGGSTGSTQQGHTAGLWPHAPTPAAVPPPLPLPQKQQPQQQQRMWCQPLIDMQGPFPSAPAAAAAGGACAPVGTSSFSLYQAPPQAQPRPTAAAAASNFPAMSFFSSQAEAAAMAAGAAEAAAALLGEMPPVGQHELQDLLADLVPQYDEARASLKLYGVTPCQLPPEMRTDLLLALQLADTAVQASIRSGCVHLTLTALASAEEGRRLAAADGAAAALARLPLARQANRPMLLQSGSSSAALLLPGSGDGGRRPLLLSFSLAAGALPGLALAATTPLATTVSAASGRFRLRCSQAMLKGRSSGGIHAPPLGLHCRCAGRHVVVSLTAVGAAAPAVPAAAADGDDDDEDLADEGAEAPAGSGSVGDSCEAEAEQEGGSEGDSSWQGTSGAAAAGLEAGAANEADADMVDAEAWVPAAEAAAGDELAGAAAVEAGWQQGWGLYEFEASRGPLVGAAVPILVLPDCQGAAASELAGMPQGVHSAVVLRLVAQVLRYL